jgi:2-hydroxychromene-2-carboxylate isomerase
MTPAGNIDATDAVEVFFDYTCPFTYRAQRWLDGLSGVRLRWRPFSLLERNYRGDGPSVWRLPERAEDISLLLFAGHELVHARGGDLAGYREAVFTAWHVTRTRLDLSVVVGFVSESGVPATAADVSAHFHDAEAEHAAGAELGVFGTPTLVYPDGTVAFVKLGTVPAADRAATLWHVTRALSGDAAELREWQRVTPGAGAR